VALPTPDFPTSSHEIDDTADMRRLISAADQIRTHVDELMTLREAAVAAAQQESQALLEKAEEDAQRIRDDADRMARETMEQARTTAGNIIRAVRDQMGDLVDSVAHQKGALDAAMSAFGEAAPREAREPETAEPEAAEPEAGGSVADDGDHAVSEDPAPDHPAPDDPAHSHEPRTFVAESDAGYNAYTDPSYDRVPAPSEGPEPDGHTKSRFSFEG
jgi:gas vesicle protein